MLASTYRPPFYLPGGDLQSILPAISRVVTGITYRRERIYTPDQDFIDIDWVDHESTKVVLIIHGLEASSDTPYVKGMAKALHASGYRVAAMNLRGCSGETNRLVRSYHSGSTDDVGIVIEHLLQYNGCESLMLVGFSLGGNLVLKYLGEKTNVSSGIKCAVTISVPCDLEACAVHLDSRIPFLYRDRFLRTLKQKALTRIDRLPFSITQQQVRNIRTFVEFDDRYTSRLYGFENAADYYKRCSSKQFIPFIRIPTLILTALNDPFFTPACFPTEECNQSSSVFLETPAEGGHVGFCCGLFSGAYYSESRTLDFLSSPH